MYPKFVSCLCHWHDFSTPSSSGASLFHQNNRGLPCFDLKALDHDPAKLLRDVLRHSAPSLAIPRCEEVVGKLLLADSVSRHVGPRGVVGVEDGSVGGMYVVRSHVSDPLVYDTDHAGNPRVVSLSLLHFRKRCVSWSSQSRSAVQPA